MEEIDNIMETYKIANGEIVGIMKALGLISSYATKLSDLGNAMCTNAVLLKLATAVVQENREDKYTERQMRMASYAEEMLVPLVESFREVLSLDKIENWDWVKVASEGDHDKAAKMWREAVGEAA